MNTTSIKAAFLFSALCATVGYGVSATKTSFKEIDDKLVEAVISGKVSQVKSLLNAGADPNACGENGVPALGQAVISKGKESPQIVLSLLKAGADPNVKVSGSPVLNFAVAGDFSKLEALIKFGADAKTLDAQGDNALILACMLPSREKSVRVAKLLLENHADVNAGADMKSLMIAAANTNLSLVELLLNYDAKPNLLCRSTDPGASALHFVGRWSKDCSVNDIVAIVNTLLKHGASIDAPDKRGQSPLISVILYAKQKADSCNVAVVQELIKNGADVQHKDSRGNDALYYAKTRGLKKIQSVLESNISRN